MATTGQKASGQPVSLDQATIDMVKIANDTEMSTVFDRFQLQKPQCKFGTDGVCCRLCHMGPCRITPKAHLGICGADADTITARNLLREIAAAIREDDSVGNHYRFAVIHIARDPDGYQFRLAGRPDDFECSDTSLCRRGSIRGWELELGMNGAPKRCDHPARSFRIFPA